MPSHFLSGLQLNDNASSSARWETFDPMCDRSQVYGLAMHFIWNSLRKIARFYDAERARMIKRRREKKSLNCTPVCMILFLEMESRQAKMIIEWVPSRVSYRVSMMRSASTVQKQDLAIEALPRKNGETGKDNAHALSINPINSS